MVEYRVTRGLDAVFSALADPTRRAILERLRGGRASVTELAKPFRISYAAVSKHLAVLSEVGLIEMKKDGRIHWMYLRKEPLKEAVDWLERYEQFWSERLDALERTLVPPKQPRRR